MTQEETDIISDIVTRAVEPLVREVRLLRHALARERDRKPDRKAQALENAKRYLKDYLAQGPKKRNDIIETIQKVGAAEDCTQRALELTCGGGSRLERRPGPRAS